MPVRIARKLAQACPTRAGLRVGFAAALIILGCETVETVVANGDTRTLSFRHTHRSDDLTITFKRNGRYDDEALKKLNYFLRDWRSDEQTRMDPQLFDILWEVYREVGGKAPINIISSYRSPSTNAMLRRRGRGVARFSQHMLGKAMDFYIPGVPLEDLRFAGLRLQRGGVGFYPSSGSPFVHLDTGSVRHWPRMPEHQLVAVLRSRQGLSLAARRNDPPRLALAARPGADDEDVAVAAPRKSKPNALAKLFGFARDEDDDEGADAPAARAPTPPSRPVQIQPVLAESVPVPAPRPTRANTFALASADSVPARQPEPRATREPAPVPPARIPEAQPQQASAAPGAIGNGGQRFVWMTGPQGRSAESVHVRSAPDVGPETTASLAPWPMPRRDDRVPTDLALAYAAEAVPERPRAAASAAAPMGALRPAPAPAPAPAAAPVPRPAAVAARPAAPARTAAAPAPAPRTGFVLNDPWIRSLVMARSVQHEMTVSTVGLPDPMGFRTLMHKPRASVALVFSADPYFGLGTDRFGGPAIAFVPTVTFNLRTAQLN